MATKLLIDILGWMGSILYLFAYALVSLKKVKGNSLLYQGMNIFAGVLLCHIHALPGSLCHYWIERCLGSGRFLHSGTKMAYTKLIPQQTQGVPT